MDYDFMMSDAIYSKLIHKYSYHSRDQNRTCEKNLVPTRGSDLQMDAVWDGTYL